MQTPSVFQIPRYLVPFDLKRLPAFRCDVLVVGSGVAGCSAALAAAGQADVILLAKSRLDATNTRYAQGGVAAVWSDADSILAHQRDTLEVGMGLCDREAVRAVVAGGHDAVQRLIAWGARFDCEGDELQLSREGGHSAARVIHARGDRTGREVQEVLLEKVRSSERIALFENVFAVDVLTDAGGSAMGVLSWSAERGYVVFAAEKTILACGGAGQIYRETTNPVVATGDGLAIALRAGARIRDAELVQFHPTLLYIAGAARVLISEIVRGAGARLLDRHGERFMLASHPRAELAPRDAVSRAIYHRIIETKDTSVYLDLSTVEGDVCKRFPGIAKICRYFDIDIRSDPIPVRPGAHYLVGGVRVDLDGRSDVRDLYACGEVASVGLHGANRLGSNSLLEGLVLGHRAGAHAAATLGGRALELRCSDPGPGLWDSGEVDFHLEDMLYSLKSLMWRNVGIERSRELLEEARGQLAFWARYLFRSPLDPVRAIEVGNMLAVSSLVTCGALEREESRGVHYRCDAPREADQPYHVDCLPQQIVESDDRTVIRCVAQRTPLAPAGS